MLNKIQNSKWVKLALGIFLLATSYKILVDPVFAANERMISDNYEIIFGTLNSGGGRASSGTDPTDYQLNISLGQTLAQKFTSSGFIVKTGFQYIHNLVPFYFSLSDVSIDYGTLDANDYDTFLDRSFTITVANYSTGYTVNALADHPLQRLSSTDQIVKTSCNGSPSCTISTAALWDDPTNYGFGYRVTGDDAPADFALDNYFRPFASALDNEPAMSVMASSGITEISSVTNVRKRQSTMTLRLGIGGVQAAGTYQTKITFIAVPSY